MTQQNPTPSNGMDLTVPARTFLRFPQLPKELQEMVWALVQEDQEQIIVRIASVSFANPGVFTISTSGIPPMLHVCGRSREIALQYNDLHFGAIQGRRLYFNMERDLLQLVGFSRWKFSATLTPAIMQDINMARNVMTLEHSLSLRNDNSYIFDIPNQLMPFQTMETFYYQELDPWQIARMGPYGRHIWRNQVASAVQDFWLGIVNQIQLTQGGQFTAPPTVYFCDAQGGVI